MDLCPLLALADCSSSIHKNAYTLTALTTRTPNSTTMTTSTTNGMQKRTYLRNALKANEAGIGMWLT